MAVDEKFWRGKRVFLTGHTGFKGSWLSLWLQSTGSIVHGFALPAPTTPSLFAEAKVEKGMESTIGDVRDYEAIHLAMMNFQPEVVFHMAAQALVRLSYDEPVQTYATNVMGTVHVLEAARQTASVRVIVNVTTDKCYENKEWEWGYRENEPMGGHDPYSNSKGCSELVTDSYRRSFFQNTDVSLATVRAGNVIGGGDWADNRLIPDILKAFENNEPVVIRNPLATRPWQHVLEPLAGYLSLAARLYLEGQTWAEAWNFGPGDDDARSVQWIVEHMVGSWGSTAKWKLDGSDSPHEENSLKLDSSKARSRLGWQPRWDLGTSLAQIITWHQAWLHKENIQDLCVAQIKQYNEND